jgi:Flp pilus assembly protein TadD/predicted aspartyl protease
VVDEDRRHSEVIFSSRLKFGVSGMMHYTRIPICCFKTSAIIAFLIILVLLSPSSAIAFEQFAASEQKDVRKLIREARKHSRAGMLSESESVLRKAVDLDSTSTEARVELALVLSKRRSLREAYELVYPIVKADPKDSRAMAVLGSTLLSGGRFSDARLVFQQAIKLNRREHLAWAGYGMTDFYENNIAESIANLREATFHAPDEPDYIFALGQVCARAERYDEAAEAYIRFLQISKNTDADRRARIKGLITFLKFLGVAGTLYKTSGSDDAIVPFSLEGNRPVIELKLNQNPRPLRFVLDTGSGISVVSDKTAKEFGIRQITRGGHAKGIGGNGKFEIVYGLVREIEIGGINIRNVPVYIRKFHSGSNPVDGYIGLSLISKFLTTIDYGEKTFLLTKKSDDTRAFRDSPERSLPLRLTSSGFLSGEVQLDGVELPLNFIVDTGASVSVISDELAKFDALSPFENDEKLRVIGSAGITDEVPTFNLRRVTFGEHSQKDIMAVALDLGIITEASGFEQAGILGGNFLRNYRLTFDFKNSRVTFVSLRQEND